jgi:ferredoxin-NADP reductase
MMKKHHVKIKIMEHATHDTLRIVTEKPNDYNFIPGQATDIAINKNGWQNEKRPFTFTSRPTDDFLEFIIKTYPSHDGATDKLLDMHVGDELILHDVFGSIRYRGEGVFIAGGAGVTPFIAMLRELKQRHVSHKNSMIFANKTQADIILKEELEELLDNRIVHILSEEKTKEFATGFITEAFLKTHISNPDQYVYVCGPMPMMEAVEKQLRNMGVDDSKVVKEGW